MTAIAHAHKRLPLRSDPEGRLLRGVKVTVVGLGKSGLAAIELCLAHGAQVLAADEKTDVPGAAALQERGVSLQLGPFSEGLWKGVEAVVVSPGVPLASGALQAAMAAGVPVVGEVELSMRLLPRGEGPLVGITGTNGKSTTTALTGELFRRTYSRVFVGGNLGQPLAEACAQRFDAHVVELSSFQLEGIVDARFNGAAILNLTPDHLDRYPSLREYGAAKARIFHNQMAPDFAVVNADDPQVVELSREAKVPVYGFSTRGSASPLAGLAVADSQGFSFNFGDRESFQVRTRSLRGAHNRENAMAAALLARLAGVSAEHIQSGLDNYPGLAHRLESVRVLDGVEWINDSKATNVESSVMALRALAAPVWLIAGGKGKGASYAPLVEAAVGKVKGVLTIGADAPTIEAAFEGAIPVVRCETLQNAVHTAREKAGEGEVVLLSPACASYDQFKNFEDRGDRFKQWVRAL